LVPPKQWKRDRRFGTWNLRSLYRVGTASRELASRWIQELGCGGMDCIDLAQDRDRCRALVNAVMNLWFPIKCGEFLDELRTG